MNVNPRVFQPCPAKVVNGIADSLSLQEFLQLQVSSLVGKRRAELVEDGTPLDSNDQLKKNKREISLNLGTVCILHQLLFMLSCAR